MGRTGIRGKGVLWRWGPNHVIKAVCTRWRQKYTAENQQAGYLYVEGKRLLEFIAVRREGDSESVYGLPGVRGHSGAVKIFTCMVHVYTRAKVSLRS